MSRIAVTGPNGMLGRHLVKFLLNNKQDVVSVDRSMWDLNIWKNNEELDVVFSDIDVVFHVGAFLSQDNSDYTLKESFDVNVRSCLNLASWATLRNIPLVFISGSTVYRDVGLAGIKESYDKVICGLGGFYGYSKLLAENVLSHFVEQGLKLIVLRPSSIYGLGLGQDKLISKLLKQASSGGVIKVSNPDNMVNMIHALDVSKAAYDAYTSSAWGIYNVSEKLYSMETIARTAIDVTGDGSIEIILNKEKPCIRFDLDCSHAKEKIGFKPNIDLYTGLKLMYLGREL